ncbi:hypothetical protein Phi13:2_gp039 [Cellulophaga phage phi13:2]|uniref:Uncharacterized protein n=1 Tax=Cellulophaga phage phi13:2 TaxID=1328030 RepID=S0A246_9CAUD|nr:hypothetical protein Phi13:2_gp039 [Cellulophaga phage phi13:2]AGO49649.1 hypothetical protein Phi13:2_gp039 [Cellulophaga phage phi13:2]
MENNKNIPWYDKSKKDLMLDHSKGWDCPDCGINLPSGIVGISSHWAQCGGKEMHENIVDFFDRKSNDFNELKDILKNNTDGE